MTVKLGPEIISVIQKWDPIADQTTRKGPGLYGPSKPGSFLGPPTLPAGVSVDEEEEVLIETRRIIQINNIIDRIADKDDIVRYWLSNPIGIKAEKMREDLFGQDPVPFGPAYVEPLPDCPQFEQIKSYLFENRLKLALDTMGWLPENTLYHYIRWNRG